MVHALDRLATYRLVAAYVDRVRRGASPAGLPLERLGLTVPQSLLLRADKVID